MWKARKYVLDQSLANYFRSFISYDVGTNEILTFTTDKGNNNFGKKLINLCKITGLQIVNLREGKD